MAATRTPGEPPESTNAAALAGARGACERVPEKNLPKDTTDRPVRARIIGTLSLRLTRDAEAIAREAATQLGHPDDEWIADLPRREGPG